VNTYETNTVEREGAPSRPATGVVALSTPECWRRIRSRDLGRIAVVIGMRPEVLPVNYRVVQETAVIRTAGGAKLKAAQLSPVCFEIDSWEERTGTGWSVMIHGHALEVRGPSDPLWTAAQEANIRPVAPGFRSRWVAIHADAVTGRYFSDGPTPWARSFGRR